MRPPLRSTVVEHRSLVGELPALDLQLMGDHCCG